MFDSFVAGMRMVFADIARNRAPLDRVMDEICHPSTDPCFISWKPAAQIVPVNRTHPCQEPRLNGIH